MIVRWMAIGFALWIAIALAFRFVGGLAFHSGPWGVPWLLLILPLALWAITYLLIGALRVTETDRSEAASIMSVPGLLVGIYEINSFGVVFPNLDASLGAEFAILMFACYAAVIMAGRTVLTVRWMALGFGLWIALAALLSAFGNLVLQPGPGGVSWAFLTLPLALLVLTYVAMKIMNVPQTDRSEAATSIAVPGLLVGLYEIDRFGVLFPGIDPSISSEFAALMFACYAAVILAGIVSSRLESI
ncbi:MAG: DUF5367 family protein [Hyphomonadaceae bacterium]